MYIYKLVCVLFKMLGHIINAYIKTLICFCKITLCYACIRLRFFYQNSRFPWRILLLLKAIFVNNPLVSRASERHLAPSSLISFLDNPMNFKEDFFASACAMHLAPSSLIPLQHKPTISNVTFEASASEK